ncbi:MAG: SUF system NifU family Fe-S cluster assembly protein [Oscillospiraceae bacterium]|jgi:nitrogen fixation NifU-like protein|nr:SUF system NifU family Fe-S cluster assembly protein [Oscillospiraceae bacterium]
MSINSVYTQIITDAARDKTNRREIPGAQFTLSGVNPSCGDEIAVQLELDTQESYASLAEVPDDVVITDCSYLGQGCAISQASAAFLAELLTGKTVGQARELRDTFLGMIKGSVTDEEALDKLEDAQALAGVAKMPARVKCATLAWHTLSE